MHVLFHAANCSVALPRSESKLKNTRMDEQKQALLEMSARLKTISRKMRVLKMKEGRKRRRHNESMQVAAAKMLLSWGGGNIAVAQSFLQKLGRCEPTATARDLAEVEEWWNKSSDVSRLIAGEPVFVKNGDKVKKEADKFMSQAALHSWVENMNMKGLTPCSHVIVQHAAPGSVELAGAADTLGSAKRKHRYQWLRRFRHRWGVRIGKVHTLEQVTPEESIVKAAPVNDYSALQDGIWLLRNGCWARQGRSASFCTG